MSEKKEKKKMKLWKKIVMNCGIFMQMKKSGRSD